MIKLQTERLIIEPMTQEELQGLIELHKTDDPELSAAYKWMLDECKAHPEQYLWYIPWKLCAEEDNSEVGYAGFKGLNGNGSAEIGYGMNEQYMGKGFATEAVRALCEWAFSTAEVRFIEAEALADNFASLRVLQKNGFTPTGCVGEEGPRFILHKSDFLSI